MSVNRATIIGNLGLDPELRHTASGTAVVKLRVATSRKFKDRDGMMQEDTQWHNVVVWGKQAESCDKYLNKGRQVYVEGRLQTNKWTGKDGNDRYTTEIVAETVQFLGGKSDDQRSNREEPNETFNTQENTDFSFEGVQKRV